MASRTDPHDDQTIRAARKKRERQLREEQRGEWDRFEHLTRRLVRTPKPETETGDKPKLA